MTAQDAAREYTVRYEWKVIPIPFRKKSPVMDGWQHLRLSEADLPTHFNGQPANIGILLGPVSGGLYDVDLDCAEALRLALYFLPATLTFGRTSKPESHWLYTADEEIRTKKYVLGQETLVELRGTSKKGTPHQTVFPPSVHESGEQIQFDNKRPPTPIDASVLQCRVRHLAVACLFLRQWPTASGTRHERAMALSGALLRAEWSVEDTEDFIRAIATEAGDDEVEDRVRVVRDTKASLDAGVEVTGWPRLAALFGEDTARQARKWLGIKNTARTGRTRTSRKKTEAQRPSVIDVLADMEPIPDAVFDLLPNVLRAGLPLFEDLRERDVFVTGALGVLSGCLPNVWGRYDTGLYAPNLYAFIIAPPGSGKGALRWARKLGQKVQAEIRRRSAEDIERWQYAQEQYKAAKRKKGADPVEHPGERPPERRLFIPGDASAAAMVNALEASGGHGTIFETEADTISQTIEKEWGTYSDILRKAHPHEPISNLRIAGGREIVRPCLSVVLAGTPSQLPRLIPSVENGLWSRFCFYGFLPDDPTGWRDVRPRRYSTEPEDLFAALADHVNALYDILNRRDEPLRITLQDGHWTALNEVGQAFKERMFERYGYSGTGTAHRAGLHIFRLAMILTVWEAREAGRDLANASSLEASDETFEVALMLGLHYASHAETLMQALPRSEMKGSAKDRRAARLYEMLPSPFARQDLLEAAERIGISQATAYRYRNEWEEEGWIESEQGDYRKVRK